MSLLVTLLLQAGIALPQPVPINFTQASDQWPVVVSASGTVAVDKSTLIIDLQDLRVTDQPSNPSSMQYSTYRVCLAYKPAVNSWDKSTCSTPVKTRTKVEDGQSVSLPPRELEISIKDHPPIDDFWLVLEMISTPIRGKTYSVYAHSDRSVLKGLSAR